MFATLNGVKLTPGQARKAKLSGNKRGISDVILMYPSNGFHGLALELKIKGNYVTKEQKEFIAHINSNNYFGKVVYGAREGIDAIKEYLGEQ